MTTYNTHALCLVSLVTTAISLSGCDDNPSTVGIVNGYPAASDGGATSAITVFKA